MQDIATNKEATIINSVYQSDTVPLSDQELKLINAYWRAANYLSVGQIYLLDNPLLKEPLDTSHVKSRLLGHWGTTPGLNFIYVHLNRIINRDAQDFLYITGPGHGGPGLVANTYLEGTYSAFYPDISQDEVGMKKLFKQFSFPGGIPSHVAPETPGSIHEGGELGYALAHAYGAVFDNPNLIACCVVGDGEAETGPLATSWHSNKFINPETDGAVLPVLHLNGYKISNPALLARIDHEELVKLFEGYGYQPFIVEGDDPLLLHQQMAATMDHVMDLIINIQTAARQNGFTGRPRWPMIILKTPKGWTGPKEVDGVVVEGSHRSHQVPINNVKQNPEHLKQLETWLKSYQPEELFDEAGCLMPEIARLAPTQSKRMGAQAYGNGGLLLQDLKLPNFQDYALDVKKPGTTKGEATRVLGQFVRDIIKNNQAQSNFRLFGPDETESNRLSAVYETTDKVLNAHTHEEDNHVAHQGRVMEVLSEHLCQGWLEGYLLTGRHGLFSCYEAFIHIIDSMFNQHAKWLKTTRQIPWRRPIASLNYLLTSHVWRQDHNGFSHQDPGFIDHVINKKAEVVRVYLPVDANTLLSVGDHCLRSRNYINVIIAGKQPSLQYLDMDAAIKHCTAGVGIWDWASNDQGHEPDVVIACAGDVPTMEALAATDGLRQAFPELKIRFVNVIDLMTLQADSDHPHGLSDADFDAIFTRDKPVIFAFHGYPWLIQRLIYRRQGQKNFHVHGYIEEGTTTTPFDMAVLNKIDRFHLMVSVIDHVEALQNTGAHFKQQLKNKLLEHKHYVCQFGEDMPEIVNWTWQND